MIKKYLRRLRPKGRRLSYRARVRAFTRRSWFARRGRKISSGGVVGEPRFLLENGKGFLLENGDSLILG